jgi:ABC-type polysaccharide/polyol phosphate export permease
VVLRLIIQLFKLNFKTEYISRFSYLFEILAAGMSLTIYHFTSEAFNSSVNDSLSLYEMNYFEFIVVGEVLLALPLFFLEGTFRKVKQSLVEGVWETMSYLNIDSVKAVFYLVLSAVPKEIFKISIVVGLSYLFFDFNVSPLFFLISFIVIILISPIFFSLGLLFSLILLRYGRGQSLIGYFLTVMSIGAGSFFPISVLPQVVRDIFLFFPYTRALESSRIYIAQSDLYDLSYTIMFIPWFILFPLSIFIFKKYTKFKDTNSIVVRV